MNKPGVRHLVLLAPLLAACACSVLPDPPPPLQPFDLGPLTETSAAPVVPGCIALDRVEAPSWMEGTGIHYRLLRDQPQAYRTYAYHAWVAPPTELVAQRIRRLLFSADCGSSAGHTQLHVQLVTFEQVFESPERAYTEVHLYATLSQGLDSSPVRRVFAGRRESRPDVYGAVEALPALTDELIMEMGAWIAGQVRPFPPQSSHNFRPMMKAVTSRSPR